MSTAIYLRISSDPTGKRAGVTRQQEDCLDLCQSREWPVEEVYTDNDISAYSGKRRPAYEKLLSDIMSGRISRVVAWHPDRLHRSPLELEGFIGLVEKHGIDVETVQTGRWDLSTAGSRLAARVLGTIAAHESEHKSERIKRALRQRAEQGMPTGGGRRFGYSQNGMTVQSDEAAAVQHAARQILAGVSLRYACVHLNRYGPPTVTGATWNSTILRQILTSERTGGLRVHQGEVLGPAAWEPLLDAETWHAVRAILNDPARRTAHSTVRVHLLSNLARCGSCGAGLMPHQTKGKSKRGGEKVISYVCTKAGCREVAIRQKILDTYVTEMLFAWWEQNEVPTFTPVAETEELIDLGRQIAAVQIRMDEAKKKLTESDVVSLDDFNDMWRRWTARLTDLKAEQARRNVSTLLRSWDPDDIRAQWTDANLAHRRALVEACFPTIIVDKATTRGPIFDPDRVTVQPISS